MGKNLRVSMSKKNHRSYGITPPHDVEVVCYCADAYTGIDCSKEVADVVMASS